MKPNISVYLQNIYEELNSEMGAQNVNCDACGKCCNFQTFDHVLYASRIESDYILENVNTPLPEFQDNKTCPFMIDHYCTVREFRTLGCRVFFCDNEYKKNLSQDIYNKYYRKIQELSIKYNLDWEYKPLNDYLKPYQLRYC